MLNTIYSGDMLSAPLWVVVETLLVPLWRVLVWLLRRAYNINIF